MQTSWRRILATLVAWAIAVRVLRHVYPLSSDTAGPMSSFYLFHLLPDLHDYHQNQWGYDVLFLLPYCLVAFVAVMPCLIVAPRITKRWFLHLLLGIGMILAAMGLNDLLAVWHHSGIFFGTGVLLKAIPVGVATVISAECVLMFHLGRR